MKKNERDKYVTAAQFGELLSAAKEMSINSYLLFLLAGNLGLRVGEVVRLRKENFTERSVRVPSLKKVKGERVKRGQLPKTFIEIPLPKEIWELVKDVQKGWIFPSPRDKHHISTMYAQMQFKKIAKIAGLPSDISIHALRHYTGYMIWQKTKDLKAIQVLLRHSSMTSSMWYTHLTFEDAERIQEAIGVVK